MTYLVLFFLFVIAAIVWVTLSLPPKKAAALLMNSGPMILMGVGGLLTLFRRGFIGVPLMLLGISWWRRSQVVSQSEFPKGRKSTVRSLYLEMELDHDTGEMDGYVLRGGMEGLRLSSMKEEEIVSLYLDVQDDGDSVALLESFLDRYHPDWRESRTSNAGSSSGGAGFETMTKEEAYQVLGLEPGASPEEIHQAWRRLVKAVHPDSGGSAFLAAKINAARDLLLG